MKQFKKQHPIAVSEFAPDVHDNVKFVRPGVFKQLGVPWTRCQDLPGLVGGADIATKIPEIDDLVIAWSHPWPYQTHPDPIGEKHALVEQFLGEIRSMHKPKGTTLNFIDFLSVTQRPFKKGQAPRSEEEERSFVAALKSMPFIYLLSDVVVHLDFERQAQVPEDGMQISTTMQQLNNCVLAEFGGIVQVVDFVSLHGSATEPIHMFDMIEEVNGQPVHSIDDIRHAPNKCRLCKVKGRAIVKLRRAPFGKKNSAPSSQRPWVFLERFITMIKIAMATEYDAKRIVFSNDQHLLQDLLEGGASLRDAAQGGELEGKMKEFEARLLDACSNYRPTSSDGAQHKRACSSNASINKQRIETNQNIDSDFYVIFSLMEQFSMHLAAHWSATSHAQRRRQFLLAVNRDDANACRALLSDGSLDLNAAVGDFDSTALHLAAKYRSVEVARVLVEYRADLCTRDAQGNCAANVLSLVMRDATISMFEMLAPSPDQLQLRNNAGVTPFQRFTIYALTADDNKPYISAQKLLFTLTEAFPCLSPPRRQLKHAAITPLRDNVEEGDATCIDYGSKQLYVEVFGGSSQGIHVLLLAFGYSLPWDFQKSGARILAKSICENSDGKVFVVCHNVVSVAADTLLADFLANLLGLIESLPLNEKFVLVDNSCGAALPLVWQLKRRLLGVCVLNCRAFWSTDYLATWADEEFAKRAGSGAQADHHSKVVRNWQERNVDWIVKIVLNINAYMCTENDVVALELAFHSALASAPASFFDFMPALFMWTRGPLARALHDLPSIADLPAIIVCGAFAPQLLVQDSMYRLAYKLTSAELAFIPYSKVWWEVEGNTQQDYVCDLVNRFLKDIFVWPSKRRGSTTFGKSFDFLV